MKTQTLLLAPIVLCCAAQLAAAADALTLYAAKPGGKMRLEGTSSIHDWQCESIIVGGKLSVGPGFPTEPGQAVQPGPIEAKAHLFVPVMSLKSVEKSGARYSDAMDNVMYDHLKSTQHPNISFDLTELTLKEAAKGPDAPYIFESKGNLVVAGVTNAISMPVNVWPLPGKKLKITGNTNLKMTDFKVDPPAPIGFAIKTGDDVKIIFEWLLAQPSTSATASK